VKCVNPSWSGFTHHQIAVRWWSIYICKGYPSGNNCPTSNGSSWVIVRQPKTQDEDNTSSDDDALDIIHDSDWQDEDEGGGTRSDDGCPSRNLFASFELQANNEKESKYALLQRKLRSFLSIYAALGTDEQFIADNRVDTLIS